MPPKSTKPLVIKDIRRKQSYLRSGNGRFTSLEKQERRQLMIYLALIFGTAAFFIACGYLHDYVANLLVNSVKLWPLT